MGNTPSKPLRRMDRPRQPRCANSPPLCCFLVVIAHGKRSVQRQLGPHGSSGDRPSGPNERRCHEVVDDQCVVDIEGFGVFGTINRELGICFGEISAQVTSRCSLFVPSSTDAGAIPRVVLLLSPARRYEGDAVGHEFHGQQREVRVPYFDP